MTVSSPLTLADRLIAVRATIAAACARVNRSPDSVTLVAVSKTHPAEAVLEAASHELVHFGENRLEEAESKIRSIQSQSSLPLVWHMIGHVQSRKARDVIALFDVIHSLDSLKLAERY